MRTGRYLAICVVLVVWAGLAAGATIRVPADYPTIPAAIGVANNGDEIEVARGTYDGPGDETEGSALVDFKGKAVRLYSRDGPGVTTIDGSRYQHVVRCISGEGCRSRLEGFTITHGGWGEYPSGGGMYNESSSPTVINCLFVENHAYSTGGGMYNVHASPVVKNCTFTKNQTYMDGCNMSNYDASPVVINCIFADSSSVEYGGGMYNNSSSPTVTNCLFSGNAAVYEGGAMYNLSSSPTITHCTFVNNVIRVSGEGGGGGMYNENSSPTVTNCILWGNSGGQITGNSGTVTCSNIQGGWPGAGNIDADPGFAGAGDYHLAAGSPCIDAGTNCPPGGLPDADLDGNPRPVDGDGDGDAVADMGAYEAPAAAANVGQLLADLICDVRALNVVWPIHICLEAKLVVARRVLADDKTRNDAAAIHSLRAFVIDVKAWRGRRIPRADADALIAAARQIIDLLNSR